MHFYFCSIPCDPSRYDGYADEIGGHYKMLIGKLTPPSDSPWLYRYYFANPYRPLNPYQTSLFQSLPIVYMIVKDAGICVPILQHKIGGVLIQTVQ